MARRRKRRSRRGAALEATNVEKSQVISENSVLVKKEIVDGQDNGLVGSAKGATVPIKKAVDQQFQKVKESQSDKKALVTTTKHTQKVKPSAILDKKSAQQIAQPHQDSLQTNIDPSAKSISQNSNVNIHKHKFSIQDPCTPEFIMSLRSAFNSEIKLMQTRLLDQASLYPERTDDDMIVAKIYIKNNSNIADNIIEFIRSELIGWIGAYQQQGMHTPIFHNLTNNKSYITIICENKYSLECVERCVKDIDNMKTMGYLKILVMPPITPTIYCFDAKYDGIASDSGLFLSQLRLHKPKLYSDDWVVASHKVYAEERKTYFMFLIDERSALSLNFLYSRSFLICMQQMTFRSRGIVKFYIPNLTKF